MYSPVMQKKVHLVAGTYIQGYIEGVSKNDFDFNFLFLAGNEIIKGLSKILLRNGYHTIRRRKFCRESIQSQETLNLCYGNFV